MCERRSTYWLWKRTFNKSTLSLKHYIRIPTILYTLGLPSLLLSHPQNCSCSTSNRSSFAGFTHNLGKRPLKTLANLVSKNSTGCTPVCHDHVLLGRHRKPRVLSLILHPSSLLPMKQLVQILSHTQSMVGTQVTGLSSKTKSFFCS